MWFWGFENTGKNIPCKKHSQQISAGRGTTADGSQNSRDGPGPSYPYLAIGHSLEALYLRPEIVLYDLVLYRTYSPCCISTWFNYLANQKA